MSADATSATLPPATDARARQLFDEERRTIWQQTDYLFAGLLVFQYFAGIIAAILVSPLTWVGPESEVHVHVWAAILLGGILISLPLFLVWRRPGDVLTRHSIAVAQMLFSALLIHLCGGRIETHFHVFGSLAFLAFYRDWRVLLTATVVVALDHFIRGIYWPESVFGVLTASPYRALEHAGWVVFEDIFLVRACLMGVRELRDLTARQAQLEATNELVEAKVRSRTLELETSQSELRRSENRNRAIVETAADGIITINRSGVIQSFNPAAEETFGYKAEETVGCNVKMLMPPPYCDEHDQYIQQYLTSGVAKIIGARREVAGLRRDRTTFPIELAVSEVDAGEEGLFTGIVRDISERVNAQRQLHAQADELAKRNAELTQLKDEADQANVAKSQFLANMSHELRTPMNAIIGYSEMLEEELTDLEQTELVEDVQKIHAAGRQLLELINDVLDLSKIEAGKAEIHAEEFDLSKFLDDVQVTVQPLLDKNANRLTINRSDQLGVVYSDQTKLRQCLLNLLSNAGKFTENGDVTVDASRSANHGIDWVELAVCDTGIGMNAEQLTRVFDAFTQAESSTTRKYGGTGLGLTITKRFCEMLGGDLSVESEVGVGTTFRIRVPARVPSLRAAELSEASEVPISFEPKADSRQRHDVLVVDDDPVILDLMTRFLAKEGYNAVAVSEGQQAVEIARERQPMAITLDVMMPRMDGWSVLKQLKDDPSTANIPVIMISMVDDTELAFAVGVENYLTKPVERDRLSDMLQRFRDRDSGCQILIVDDDANNREMLVRLVRKADCVAIEAGNGREALARVDEQLPDLILLDLMMPTMDGFEFVRELNLREVGSSIPIIVLTAKELTVQEREQLTAKVSSIRQKGRVSREELLREIKHCLQKCAETLAEPKP